MPKSPHEAFKPLLATWWAKSILIVVATLLLIYLIRQFKNFLHARLIKTRHIWDDVFVDAIYKPLQMITLLHGVMALLYTISTVVTTRMIVRYYEDASKFIFILALFWFAIRYISSLEARLINRAKKAHAGHREHWDQTTVRGVCQFARIVVGFFILLFILELFGVGLSGLLAFSGFSSIAVAFAAKDLLANFFGGFMVFYDRPFSVGDWISSPDKNIEGTVEHIGWRLTRIRAFDKRPMYVPNSVFSTIVIVNPQRMTNRRIKSIVGVRYQDQNKIAAITQAIEDMLANHPDIDQSCTSFVRLVNFGPSSLDLLVYTFTKTTQWVPFQRIQQEVFLKIIEIVNQHEAECAFPTTTLDLPDRIDMASLIGSPKTQTE